MRSGDRFRPAAVMVAAGVWAVGIAPVTAASGYTVRPDYAAGTCHAHVDGVWSLPDRHCTPGAADPRVRQSNIASTICVSGYTRQVRPAASVTSTEKVASLSAYGDPRTPSAFEYDHLIPLELGGAPNDKRNLWPEPGSSPNPKDRLERKLHTLVCRHTISLATAQHAIATSWVAAYRKYVGSAPAGSGSTTSPKPVSSTPPSGATAKCNDGTYSYAAHHSGACSHHGGVAVFYR